MCDRLILSVSLRSGHPSGDGNRISWGSVRAMHTWSWMADTHDPMLPVLQGRDSPAKKPAKAR